ncbi:MAG: hypothetical protein EKK68_02755 [Candidatus Competibacteraceae bacterium]|nr:MAG: hypothetical protein EKK68_02755 [Candidatus Competibacteraceae bacterium]
MIHALSFPVLQIRRQELLDELDELEEAVTELIVWLRDAVEVEADALAERQERLAWLYRQQAGVLAVLSETERALLAFSESAV